MKNISNAIRKFILRILGISQNHLLCSMDYIFLHEDSFSSMGIGSYENGAKVWRWSDAKLIVGKYCSIAHGVNFIVDDANHSISNITTSPLFDNLFDDHECINSQTKGQFLSAKRGKSGILIGNDVWIGMGAIIMPGVTIGNGVTIAAGSVVTKSFPSYCFVAGVPAKIVKDKCQESEKMLMNNIAWWDWDKELIKERIIDFSEFTISEFISKYNK